MRMLIRVPVWDMKDYQIVVLIGDVCCGLESGSVVTVKEMESHKEWDSLYLREVFVSEIKDTPRVFLDQLEFDNASDFRLFLAKANHLSRLAAETVISIYVFADPEETLDFLTAEEEDVGYDDVQDIVRLFDYNTDYIGPTFLSNPGETFTKTTLDNNTTPIGESNHESDGV